MDVDEAVLVAVLPRDERLVVGCAGASAGAPPPRAERRAAARRGGGGGGRLGRRVGVGLDEPGRVEAGVPVVC